MSATATALDLPRSGEVNTNQAYEGLKNLIHHLVQKFNQRYGGDYEELVSEANLHFARACRTYNPRKAKLITHVYARVWYGLLDTLRPKSHLREGPRDLQRLDILLDSLPDHRAPSRLPRPLKDLSGDAKVAVKLAMAASHWGPHAAKRRKVIGALKEMGWTMRQVLQAFAEVREHLGLTG